MKLLVVNNLSSGIGDGAIYDYLRMVLGDGDEASIRCTDGTTELATLLEDAEDFDAVVLSGGDGSMAAVSYALANSGIPILPFPAGTANVLVNNLMLPYEPHALAKATREMKTLDFDLGEIESNGQKFGFNIMAGAGYDAKIMHDAQPSKKILGPVAYFKAAVENALTKPSKIKLVIDGETIESEGLCVLLVNFSRIQFEIPVTHGSDARDGMFEVVVCKGENAFGLIPAVIAGLRDRDGAYPDRTDSMEIYHGHTVEVDADPPFEIQFDGELPTLTTPFTARVLDGAACFIVTDTAIERYGN